MKTYNFAIIGTGSIANKMAEALSFVQGAKKYAIASRTADKAERFAEKWRFEKAYGSYEQLVQDPKVDVVYIATPHNLHFVNTMMCLEHGKHVLCEKPMAVNLREVMAMTKMAAEKKLFLMEAMWSRFLPNVNKVKELIDDGSIGDTNLLVADFCIKRDIDFADRKFNRELIGGSLLDIGIYPLFLSQYLLGHPKEVVASAAIGESLVDYSCGMLLKYDGVKMANLCSSFIAETGVNATVHGTRGIIKMAPWWYTPGPVYLFDSKGEETKFDFNFVGNGYNYEVDEVIRCLNLGLTQSPLMSWQHSIDLVTLLDAIRMQCGISYPAHDLIH